MGIILVQITLAVKTMDNHLHVKISGFCCHSSGFAAIFIRSTHNQHSLSRSLSLSLKILVLLL